MFRISFGLGLLVFLYGCQQMSSHSFSPSLPGYSPAPHRTVFLKKPLREISGIYYHSSKELVAINDEQGALFFIHPETGEFRKKIFGAKGDYEDVVETDSAFYVLESNGRLHEVDSSGTELAVYSQKFHKSIEFESLCYDAKRRQLLLICKSCGPKETHIHAWRFDLATKTYQDIPEFSIDLEALREMGKDYAILCKPSAAAFHPITGKLYLIASVGKLLVVCSHEGKLEAVYKVNPDQFQQPEGLCFSPEGDLYISNEGAEHKASLLFFPQVPDKK